MKYADKKKNSFYFYQLTFHLFINIDTEQESKQNPSDKHSIWKSTLTYTLRVNRKFKHEGKFNKKNYYDA